MTASVEKQFFRLDEFESNTVPSKVEILDAIEAGKIPLHIKCKNQQGIVFSVKKNKVVAHCVGVYSGHLKMTLEGSVELAENDSYTVRVGTIDEHTKFEIKDGLLPEALYGVYESSKASDLKAGKEYGFYLNVSLASSCDEAFEESLRTQTLARNPYTYNLEIEPFSEMTGTKRDAVVQGRQFKLSNARISVVDLEKLKLFIESNKAQKLQGFRKTNLNLFLVRMLKKNIHFSADEVWREMENELNKEVREYDIDHILLPPRNKNSDVVSLQWIDKKGEEKTVNRNGFDQRLSRLRKDAGISKS